jgi:hypothetical protein
MMLVRNADANGFSSDWPFTEGLACTRALGVYLLSDPLIGISVYLEESSVTHFQLIRIQ